MLLLSPQHAPIETTCSSMQKGAVLSTSQMPPPLLWSLPTTTISLAYAVAWLRMLSNIQAPLRPWFVAKDRITNPPIS